MNPKTVIFVCAALFLCALAVGADNTKPMAWTQPGSLGSGSEPFFSLDSRHQLSVTFEGDKQSCRSLLQKDGTWTQPELIASGLPENTIQAFDRDGNRLIAQEIDGAITVATVGPGGAMAKKDVVVDKQKNVYLHLLHYSIDDHGTSHLVYGRTPHYDCEANNPGAAVFYRRSSGNIWEKELLINRKMSLSRIWQKPGVAVDAQGRVYVCSYQDLYSIDAKNEVLKETCPLADFSMPVALVAQGAGTLHVVYHPFADKTAYEQNSLYYVMRQDGTWGKPCKVGSQPCERTPAIILTPARELYVAWEDLDGNVVVSMGKVD